MFYRDVRSYGHLWVGALKHEILVSASRERPSEEGDSQGKWAEAKSHTLALSHEVLNSLHCKTRSDVLRGNVCFPKSWGSTCVFNLIVRTLKKAIKLYPSLNSYTTWKICIFKYKLKIFLNVKILDKLQSTSSNKSSSVVVHIKNSLTHSHF